MRRRGVLLLALLVCHSLAGLCGCAERPSGSAPARIVSLSPPLTETLFYLGAAKSVVGVSDYCRTPPDVATRPRVGTSIRPDYERIARLTPTLIVTEASMTHDRAPLDALARAELVPWLTLQEVLPSIRRLGTLTGRLGPAEQLAASMEALLSAQPPPEAPRVLLVIYGGSTLDEVLFVRDNSLHGAALRAAGARNAVLDPVRGVPRMSLEALLELDPPAIVLLAEPNPGATAILAPWWRLTPLRAIRAGRLAVIAGSDVFTTGPSVIGFVARLRATLARMGMVG